MVDQSDIAEMARLRAIIGNADAAMADTGPAASHSGPSHSGTSHSGTSHSGSNAAGPTPVGNANVAAMKDILQRYTRGAEAAATALVAQSSSDRALREAMLTERTDDGLTIGVWRISAKTDSGRKLYDVTRIDQSVPIAQDLALYEAARGLANALNDGDPITSRRIRDLLTDEDDFSKALHNAIHAKSILHRVSQADRRRPILEDKYSAAVRRGQAAKRRIIEMSGRE